LAGLQQKREVFKGHFTELGNLVKKLLAYA
jgi:hypothetical protein